MGWEQGVGGGVEGGGYGWLIWEDIVLVRTQV